MNKIKDVKIINKGRALHTHTPPLFLLVVFRVDGIVLSRWKMRAATSA
jgi:hypothetical protein